MGNGQNSMAAGPQPMNVLQADVGVNAQNPALKRIRESR